MSEIKYDSLVMAFADMDGKILAKAAMKKDELSILCEMHGISTAEMLELLYKALEEDYIDYLKTKNMEEKS